MKKRREPVEIMLWIVICLSFGAIAAGTLLGFLNNNEDIFNISIFISWFLPSLGTLAMALTGLLIYKQFEEQKRLNILNTTPYVVNELLYGFLFNDTYGKYALKRANNESELILCKYTLNNIDKKLHLECNAGEPFNLYDVEGHYSIECWNMFVNRTNYIGNTRLGVLVYLDHTDSYECYRLNDVQDHHNMLLNEDIIIGASDGRGGHYNFPSNFEGAPTDVVDRFMLDNEYRTNNSILWTFISLSRPIKSNINTSSISINHFIFDFGRLKYIPLLKPNNTNISDDITKKILCIKKGGNDRI